MTELAKAYDPKGVEDRWYAFWRDGGYFRGHTGADGDPFCIVIPPPNVTGILHMGHALNNTLQDVLIRRARMMGRPTLWLPGTDHAGIATQNVVERRLSEEGLTRHDLGREAFIERVWDWKDEYEARILGQLERLGCSCDWERTRFTMDEGLSRAVRTVFVRLYEEGLIYRGNRIINWCPRCTTALSDIEVEYSEREGELVTMRYPLADGSGHIAVATTRVETMLGDTGVAVHPEDERYRDLIGRTVVLPIVGREIPIVADDAVDPGFGTGAVKVTPAHDPNDFEIAERSGLEAVNVFDREARITADGGRFEGMDRLEARKAVLEALRAEGIVENEERPYLHSVGHCSRCQTAVEPWLSEQWFVAMKDLAAPAVAAVTSGRTRLHPERPFTKTYTDWMQNIRDWCISRQLWWGHRVPVWYCDNGHRFAALDDPSACADCGSEGIEQDPDVLDTWFSSWLWPISTLGWPEETDDLQYWYPTSVLVTGYDILFFWVSRMIMSGLHFRDDVPFHDVVLTGLVRDWEGKKMSKSAGNQIDPLDLVDRYGTDALRFTLTRASTPGADMNLNEDWIEGSRHFCNKLWNASRFVLQNLDGASQPIPEDLELPERWILSRLEQTRAEADAALAEYQFSEAARSLYHFVWSEYCDWYLETAKLSLRDEGKQAATRAVLHNVLETSLRLCHPIMPFITEEIWQRLPRDASDPEALIVAPWPEPQERGRDAEAEEHMEFLQSIVLQVRRFRHEHSIPPRQRIEAVVGVAEPYARLIESYGQELKALASLSDVRLGDGPPDTGWSRVVAGPAEVYLPLSGVVDLDAERARLTKEIEAADDQAGRLRGKLSNTDFVERAPGEVVQRARDQLATLEAKLEKLNAQLGELG